MEHVLRQRPSAGARVQRRDDEGDWFDESLGTLGGWIDEGVETAGGWFGDTFGGGGPAPTPGETSGTPTGETVPSGGGGTDTTDEQQVDHDYVNRFTSGVVTAYEMWKLGARISGARVFAASAMGGTLTGASLAPLILSVTPAPTAEEHTVTSELASALEEAFQAALSTFSLPGLAMYPAFTEWPGPSAPPMPCTPQQLVAALPGLGQIAGASSPVTGTMAASAAAALSSAAGTLTGLVAGTQIVNALGTGPVPSYAPPAVQVGPVINGEILPTAGVLR